jgi:hypothetical protein
MNNEEIAAVGERLKTEEPPLSLEQARERRASITQQRKDSINLIRKRTASRVENTGRPALEGFPKTKNGA